MDERSGAVEKCAVRSSICVHFSRILLSQLFAPHMFGACRSLARQTFVGPEIPSRPAGRRLSHGNAKCTAPDMWAAHPVCCLCSADNSDGVRGIVRQICVLMTIKAQLSQRKTLKKTPDSSPEGLGRIDV